ncbi:hypothetical protein CDAR_256651 [Caerostris darwini]|uniref:Uncharacterized protein n=1 Tax=Caerostris darwini TaxID=1538125 RepID=A0AAV4Q034_9ARAC|nr:hypothetical protein CDAR_256651 [Caerostris darwini]
MVPPNLSCYCLRPTTAVQLPELARWAFGLCFFPAPLKFIALRRLLSKGSENLWYSTGAVREKCCAFSLHKFRLASQLQCCVPATGVYIILIYSKQTLFVSVT